MAVCESALDLDGVSLDPVAAVESVLAGTGVLGRCVTVYKVVGGWI